MFVETRRLYPSSNQPIHLSMSAMSVKPWGSASLDEEKINWAVLSDEQMSNGYPFSLLNDEQMSNKVRVEHQPVNHPGDSI